MKQLFQNIMNVWMLKTLILFILFSNSNFSYSMSEITDSSKQSKALKSGFTLSDPLFGNPPDSNPIIFGQGIITLQNRGEYGVAISPDLSEIFYTASGVGLMIMNKQQDGSWSTPKVANLRRSNSEEFEAFYSYDGNKVFFSYMVGEYDSRITYVEKTASGYSAPFNLDSPINNYSVFWSTLTKTNTLYFTNFTLQKTYRSKFKDGKYNEIEDAGLPRGSFHPFISPNEDFVLFDLDGNIYICFSKSDGKWNTPIKLGSKINTNHWESCASLSPDGKYIFFARYNDVNDKSDIYWAKIDDVINSLRPDVGINEGEPTIPNNIQLFQNYPNPFNPETTINYTIPSNVKGETINVTLKIFDVLGREVATLVDEYKQAGTYNSQFSIRNFSPRSTRVGAGQLSSGVYFYTLKANGFTQTKKMILLR